jgi:NTE family protein
VLALGGGFSRGFAHLGVIEVLEQEHIAIAGIVGTSIGSLLGAAFADGIPIRELCELGRRVRIRDFIHFYNSQHKPESKDRIGQFVREWFHASRIEDLSIPMNIVTTDLDTCAPYVFSRGPLDVAIRASCAFPGLFEPVEYEGHTLVDGCLISPVPTVAAARMNAGCVLGVAVNSGVSGSAGAGSAAQGSSGMLAMTRGTMLSSPTKLSPPWMRNADLMLEPDVRQIGWSDFSRVEEARDAGAQAMRAALPYLHEVLSQAVERKLAAESFRHLEERMVS